jgi:hypothetical protein
MTRIVSPEDGSGAVLTPVPARVVLLTTSGGVPRWTADWCRHTGRCLHVRRLRPGGGSDAGGRAVERVGALAGDLVLVVPPDLDGATPRHLVAALRDLDAEPGVLRHAAQVAEETGGELVVLHAVPWSFGERSIGLDAAVDAGRTLLAAAVRWTAARTPDVRCRATLVRAHPHEAVGGNLLADLLVLGGPRPGRPEPGPVVSTALQHAPCPVLLVPRG